MRGGIHKKGNNYYAVVYDGIDPGTGRNRRRWVPASARAFRSGCPLIGVRLEDDFIRSRRRFVSLRHLGQSGGDVVDLIGIEMVGEVAPDAGQVAGGGAA